MVYDQILDDYTLTYILVSDDGTHCF